MTRNIRLDAMGNLNRVPSERFGKFIGLSVGPDRAIYLLFTLKPVDERANRHASASSKSSADLPRDYRVVAVAEGKVLLDVEIRSVELAVHKAQPLPGEVLLASARCEFRSTIDIDKNGRVFSLHGKARSAFVLGDGIADVQTTKSGIIWTSYFDEGVFGNMGWDEPLGASGLVAWDSTGKKLYEYEAPEGLGSIDDCYAMNVASDHDVWVCYYSDFPLVHIRDMKVQGVWDLSKLDMRLRFSMSTFAVGDDHVMLWNGNGEKPVCHLFQLGKARKPKFVGSLKLCNRLGLPIKAPHVLGRGDTLNLLGMRGSIYQLRVRDAIEALGG